MASDLSRFLKAQERDYARALSEIRSGRKRSHWMWYIFPQIQGLGFSQTAQFYAIQDLAEAKDYLAHPVLGARLKEISSALLELDGLIRLADLDCPIFQEVIDKYYDGEPDKKTVRILQELGR